MSSVRSTLAALWSAQVQSFPVTNQHLVYVINIVSQFLFFQDATTNKRGKDVVCETLQLSQSVG